MALVKSLSKLIASQPNKNIFSETPIEDIRKIPQSGNLILKGVSPKKGWTTKKNNNFKEYLHSYFLPWCQSTIKEHKEALLKSFHPSTPRYAENFSIRPESWYEDLLTNANLPRLGKDKQKAIITENTSLRNLPTLRPSYIDPRKAGEGYQFDTIQENLLHVGEPVLISHFTKDGEFALVETNAKSIGFIRIKDLAFVNDKIAGILIKSKYTMIIRENINLYDSKTSEFIQKVYFSTMLPIAQNKNGKVKIHLPIRDTDGWLKLQEVNINKNDIIFNPLVFDKNNVAKVIDILIALPYGWGGYLLNRDCAQILKDYFAAFGIHIPVFSGNQIKAGSYISLADVNNNKKLQKIKSKTVPFQTILFRKGHVTLYLGEYKKKPVMFHAVWGVHLFDKDTEYRHIIGKSVITTLEYGKELAGFDHNRSSFFKLLSAMAIFE